MKILKKKKFENTSWTGSSDNFYQLKKWRTLREKYIADNPICELSGQFNIIEPGEIVDHIIPRSIAPELEYEVLNLQTLSWLNHQKKTAQSRGIKTLKDFVHHMRDGKLQYIAVPEKITKLIEHIEKEGLI